jgi:hypothetical protein
MCKVACIQTRVISCLWTTIMTELEDFPFYLPREFELKTAVQVACCG